MDKNSIRSSYENYVLEHGKKPASVFAFCKENGFNENEFYNFYSSFDGIDKEIWLAIFTETKDQLEQDETYKNYSAQEKLLAFYFLWVQKLRTHRSYILQQKENFKFSDMKDDKLELFRKAFFDYVNGLIALGHESNEIKERKFISDKYAHGFWLQALFVLKYWVEDTSANFENTDAAIEKAVTLSFKLIKENALDSLIDFGKFVFQKR